MTSISTLGFQFFYPYRYDLHVGKPAHRIHIPVICQAVDVRIVPTMGDLDEPFQNAVAMHHLCLYCNRCLESNGTSASPHKIGDSGRILPAPTLA
jgi:hypothetical protein